MASSPQPLAAEAEPEPEPPGPRATRLREAFSGALSHTLKRVAAPDGFAACFPSIAAPDVLQLVQDQMVKLLRDKCEKEFDRIMTTRDVVAKLNHFESLVADAASRRRLAGPDAAAPTPPHLLSPDAIIAAHTKAALEPYFSQTSQRLVQQRAENARLAATLADQAAAIDALMARLDVAKHDVTAATRALESVNADFDAAVPPATGSVNPPPAHHAAEADADADDDADDDANAPAQVVDADTTQPPPGSQAGAPDASVS